MNLLFSFIAQHNNNYVPLSNHVTDCQHNICT